MDINPEIYFDKSTIPVSFENTEKILSQMKNCICKIYKNKGETGTGFFCKIPYPNQSKLLKVLITNNHVLNENDLKNDNIIKYTIKDDKQIRKIKINNNNRKIYTSKELDITFIEIKENEDNINEFLEIDEELINQNEEYIETTYKNKSIYILHYPFGKDIVVSYGNLDKIKNEQINHFCNTSKGSSGSPILSLDTLKVIGIHCGSNKDDNENCNKGIFMKFPIKEFNKQNKKIFHLLYKSNSFVPNYFFNERIFGDKFVENNKDKCIVIINDKEYDLYTLDYGVIANGSFEIKLKEIEIITDMSYMFYECNNLPDISKWDTSNFTNMSYMFFRCNNLPDISKWNTSNVTDMSNMFNQCNNLPDISKWNTSNVTNMNNMFYYCKDLPDISKWDTSNVTDMSNMFCNCNNIPDISKWNTSNVTNMNNMFYYCKDLPDISKWNTSNVTDMSYMFHDCENIPDISKWDTSNLINIKGIFGGFTNLPDISKWDTSKIDNFSLLTLKSSPINIIFFDIHSGRKINIVGDEIMTFSNLVKIFHTKANISSNTNNVKFYFKGNEIDPNSNKLLKELNIKNCDRINY